MSDNSKLDGLQIARAAAALGIAYFHSWHVTMPFPAGTAHPIPILMEWGWIAVDFFFSISGFVICLVVTSPNFRPVSFLLRRAFRLYPLWIATSFIYLQLLDYMGRSERQTNAFFNWSLTLLPTNGMPFYDIGWSLQHEMLFYVLAAVVTPWFGIYGVAAVLALGVAADHATELPWYLDQYFFYYGNFLAGIAAFLVHRSGLRPGFILPVVIGVLAFRWAPTRSLFPVALFCWLVGFVNLNVSWRIGRLGALLGDASYSIYLLHPLVFYWDLHQTAAAPAAALDAGAAALRRAADCLHPGNLELEVVRASHDPDRQPPRQIFSKPALEQCAGRPKVGLSPEFAAMPELALRPNGGQNATSATEKRLTGQVAYRGEAVYECAPVGPRGGVVTQRSAKPFTPVQFWSWPPFPDFGDLNHCCRPSSPTIDGDLLLSRRGRCARRPFCFRCCPPC